MHLQGDAAHGLAVGIGDFAVDRSGGILNPRARLHDIIRGRLDGCPFEGAPVTELVTVPFTLPALATIASGNKFIAWVYLCSALLFGGVVLFTANNRLDGALE